MEVVLGRHGHDDDALPGGVLGDLDGDGLVNGLDFGLLLDGVRAGPGDLNDDGVVDFGMLLSPGRRDRTADRTDSPPSTRPGEASHGHHEGLLHAGVHPDDDRGVDHRGDDRTNQQTGVQGPVSNRSNLPRIASGKSPPTTRKGLIAFIAGPTMARPPAHRRSRRRRRRRPRSRSPRPRSRWSPCSESSSGAIMTANATNIGITTTIPTTAPQDTRGSTYWRCRRP